MSEVISWVFDLFLDLWHLIVSHWVLSFSVLLLVMSYIIDLVNSAKSR